MQNIIIHDHTTCSKCGLCAEVCPNKIISKPDDNDMSVRDDRIHLCFNCGQCMAICPTKSIKVAGLSYENDFFELPKQPENGYEKSFFDLIASRRAIRNFKDKPVPRALLEKIVNAISLAPPGFPPIKTEIIVVENTELIRKALPFMVGLYDKLVAMMKKPLIRYFIKKEVGKKKFRLMQRHLIPLLISRLPELKNGSEDTLTRNAPALILFLAEKDGEDVSQDITIAATYGMLATHSLGLGGTIMDIIPPAINKNDDLRKLFCIPFNYEVAASMILGYPKYKYQRGITRKLKSVKWL